MSYDLATFTRLPIQIPYLGFDHARRADILQQIQPGSLVRVYAGDDGFAHETFHARGLLAMLYLGESEQEFDDPPAIVERIADAMWWCDQRGIVPVAVEVGEERFWRCLTSDLASYASLASLPPVERIQRVAQQYAELYRHVRVAWPGAYTVSVEGSWTEPGATHLGTGFGGYGPVYDHVDVLGVSHYMTGASQDVTQQQLDIFYGDVAIRVQEARRLVSVPVAERSPYYRAAHVLAFAATFDDTTWRKRSAGQLDWWLRMGERADTRLDAMVFFCAEHRPGVTGIEAYPDLVQQVGDIYAYNAAQQPSSLTTLRLGQRLT